jgi:hypothetical protein
MNKKEYVTRKEFEGLEDQVEENNKWATIFAIVMAALVVVILPIILQPEHFSQQAEAAGYEEVCVEWENTSCYIQDTGKNVGCRPFEFEGCMNGTTLCPTKKMKENDCYVFVCDKECIHYRLEKVIE